MCLYLSLNERAVIYERHFVRICFVNPSDFASISLIIRARSFEIYLLSRDEFQGNTT